ncbi:helix-turn-helix domain-containing protein [Papillibacter cinnamivorans]|uniref:Transcriptional regulator, contains XRE-family HTH domain n=1 Tax=Papillibacter cinnamivorans DSM 12816 TaxID=1122930 RepID=A0A1W2ASU0_9FIRM|nr:helix-turn-helix domain-containing protein [Papillibacter cinnamivorans]SMC63654.1 Transcriptional regulator, contains XRE-family HTH domain [Papillibacter cinnamivorans DSM 12816]
MTLGEKLQQVRRQRGLSQDRLAEMLNVSRQAVSKWERDEAVPETDKIIRLSEIFSVSTDFLLKEEPAGEGRTERKQEPDFFREMGQLFRRKWYYLGYAVVAWGAWDLVQALFIRMIWGGMSGYLDDGSGFSVIVGAPVNMLWLLIIPGVVKMLCGALIVIFGRRYLKKTEGTF